ncbi:MAG: type II toxin-antitoxin system RelE/ParE family toxin [Ignavibacteriaceae bacterium]|jgi:mRNA interferase RelE/StbE
MKVELRKSAIKDLEKIHPSIKQRIVLALFSLENFPNVPNLKRLVNFDYAFRVRVGDYRILLIIWTIRFLWRELLTAKISTKRSSAIIFPNIVFLV